MRLIDAFGQVVRPLGDLGKSLQTEGKPLETHTGKLFGKTLFAV